MAPKDTSNVESLIMPDPKQDGDGDADANEHTHSFNSITEITKEEERIDDHESKYVDWPLDDIKEPLLNDVKAGRGAGTNRHNKRFREMVEGYKKEYVKCKRNEKGLVAFEIIRKWRAQSPPGRFLKKDERKETWCDIGDAEAKKKVIQALREGAPQIREEEGISGNDSGIKSDKSIRANEEHSSNSSNKLLKKPPSPYGRLYSLDGLNILEVEVANLMTSLRSTESRNTVSLPPSPAVRETSMGTFILDSNTRSSIGAMGQERQYPRAVTPSQAMATNSFCGVETASSWLGDGETPTSFDFGPMQFRGSDSSMISAGKRDSSSSEIENWSQHSDSSRVKRSALNRDQSATTNRLKQLHCPEVFNVDLQSLSQKTQQIQLSGSVDEAEQTVPRPFGLNLESRVTTRQALTYWANSQTKSDNTPRTEIDGSTNETHQTVSGHEQFDEWSRKKTAQTQTLAVSPPETEQVSRSQLGRQQTNIDALENWALTGLDHDRADAERPAHLREGDRVNTMDAYNLDIYDV